ncbi:TIGR01777 family oxidoreductase [Nakamurella sp. GG22]
MHIVAAGVSGFLGTRLTSSLTAAGHQVTRLVRSGPARPGTSVWDPDTGEIDSAVFDGADAVVNLCGVGVGDHRWNEDYKRLILSSRVNPTRLLASECARLGIPVLINASGIGYYGPHGNEIITEDSPAGDTFLGQTCVAWEGATAVAAEADVRVVTLRTGLVLGKDGGLLPKLTLLTRLMLGGKLGSGEQYFPWISVTDEIAAMIHLLTAPVHGPVNLTAPYPVTNAEFTKELGRALHRPAPWIVPGIALKVVLGEFADEVLAGQRALPIKLHDSGFEFTHRTLPVALAAELG